MPPGCPVAPDRPGCSPAGARRDDRRSPPRQHPSDTHRPNEASKDPAAMPPRRLLAHGSSEPSPVRNPGRPREIQGHPRSQGCNVARGPRTSTLAPMLRRPRSGDLEIAARHRSPRSPDLRPRTHAALPKVPGPRPPQGCCAPERPRTSTLARPAPGRSARPGPGGPTSRRVARANQRRCPAGPFLLGGVAPMASREGVMRGATRWLRRSRPRPRRTAAARAAGPRRARTAPRP